jgi:hypothetical protein
LGQGVTPVAKSTFSNVSISNGRIKAFFQSMDVMLAGSTHPFLFTHIFNDVALAFYKDLDAVIS